MITTFPHLGQVHVPVRLVLKELGIPVVVPPQNTADTLEKGQAVSPEEMCLPFKYMAGNLIEAYEAGANRVIMPATMGPCRLGEYGELLKEVLKNKGYNFQWILIDTPSAIGRREWLRRIKVIAEDKQVSYAKAIQVLLRGVYLMRKLDQLEAKGKQLAGKAVYPQECVKIIRRARKALESAENLRHGFSIIKEHGEALDVLSLDENKVPISITVTGEIYTLIESAANQNLEEKLMLMGCEVKRNITVSWWISRGLNPFSITQSYMPYNIGGFAKETIEEVLQSEGDGVIKIMPTGCMPEIVTKAVCNKISEEEGIKMLHLIFDEMQGSAGYETRVEAFIDMLERRRDVLSGNRRRIN